MALPEYALTTLATANDELSLTADSGAQDARVERYIKAASEQIARYLGRDLYKQTVTDERHKTAGGQKLILRVTPVASITSVVVDGSTIDSDGYQLEHADSGIVHNYYGWPRQGARRAGITQDPFPGGEEPDTLATYVGGYVTPAQAANGSGSTYEGDPITLPASIEHACLALVATLWGQQGAGGDVQSEKLGDAAVTYFKTGEGMPPRIAAMLEPFRDTAIL
jgi:hypothetical protein